MIITNHREKLINSIIYFAKNTKLCGRTKLMKLLFYLDFTHFKETGKSVTGLEYYAWDFGPVPADLWNEIDSGMKPDLETSVVEIKRDMPEDANGDAYLFKPRKGKRFNDEYFSNRELKILSEIAEIFHEATSELMVKSTHMDDTPWSIVWKDKGKGAHINYLLSIGRQIGGLSYDEAKNKMEEISEMYNNFGA